MSGTDIREVVKEKYGQAALRAKSARCSDTIGPCCDPITSNLYDLSQINQIPAEALQASLGCGNPTALAELNPGEIVLDLGSGGGIDVLLSARRVGPTGKAYGLDMTDEMLALANENKRKAGADNVEFLKGEIEHIPLPRCAISGTLQAGDGVCSTLHHWQAMDSLTDPWRSEGANQENRQSSQTLEPWRIVAACSGQGQPVVLTELAMEPTKRRTSRTRVG